MDETTKLAVACDESFIFSYGDGSGDAFKAQLAKCKECIDNASLIVNTALDQFSELAETPLTMGWGSELKKQMEELKPLVDKAVVVFEGIYDLEKRAEAAIDEASNATLGDMARNL